MKFEYACGVHYDRVTVRLYEDSLPHRSAFYIASCHHAVKANLLPVFIEDA